MEGIHTLKDLLGQGGWLAKINQKDTYFAIPIHQSYQKYLQFQFYRKTFCFACLPFGPCSAPWVFTKTLKPVLAVLRQRRIRMIVYIDDILLIVEFKEQALDQFQAVVCLLECLGFIIACLLLGKWTHNMHNPPYTPHLQKSAVGSLQCPGD